MASFRGGVVVTYCKSCRTEQEMKPVREGFEGKIIWLRCMDCSKMIFLNKEDYEDLLQNNKQKKNNGTEKDYVDYAPNKTFYIGQHIYHKIWDDKGEVLKKEKTNSGRQAITVAFDRLGERILVENLNV
ncbi:MAG: hypothetical protein ACE5JB_08170 [bacterium]